jgi:hypothetical protein
MALTLCLVEDERLLDSSNANGTLNVKPNGFSLYMDEVHV